MDINVSNEEGFICLLGGDGSGKTTLINGITECYPEVVVAHWKMFGSITNLPVVADNLGPAEMLLKLGPNARAAQLCYFAALEYDMVIHPAVGKGKLVVVDSYWYKFAAKMKVLNMAAEFLYSTCESLPKPREIIFLDTPLEVTMQRKADLNYFECGGSADDFLTFQQSVRREMLDFVKDIPLFILDGTLALTKQVQILEERYQMKSLLQASARHG